MKISNSKKQLARIISDNGGWRDGVEFSVSTCDGVVIGSGSKPRYTTKYGWVANGGFFEDRIKLRSYLKNWHQTIVSRDEYFHLYPAPDADGWIEWNGAAKSPVSKGTPVDVKMQNGTQHFGQLIDDEYWSDCWDGASIIAYRLHKSEQSKHEPTQVEEAKPTIEQLAADYRNAKDYAERKQQEADAAKAEAEAKLAELVAAGKVVGLAVSVVVQECPFRVGDTVRLIRRRGGDAKLGEVGAVARVDSATDLVVNFPSQSRYLVDDTDVELVSKGANNA